jgi:3'(2'), 5'-bisphosphate nucleotidase
VAEGSADLYPRFSPTSEWDIAAGHAVLLAARGELRQIDGLPLRYNTKADVINPGFIAYGDTQRNWLDLGAPISA